MKRTALFAFTLAAALPLAAPAQGNHDTVLAGAKPGDLVELPGFPFHEVPKIGFEKLVDPGPQFLISDDPEYIRVPEAVAFREKVNPGTVRLYVYNVNGVKEPEKIDRKISTVIKNLGDAPLRLRFLRYSSMPPSTNYYGIGKKGLAGFLEAKPSREVIEIPVGQARPLDEKHENAIVKYDELVHGFYEFVIDQPALISIVQTAPETPSTEAAERIKEVLPIKSHSGAGRGQFGVSNYTILPKEGEVIDTAKGPVQLIVADGEDDPWIQGKDEPSGTVATLKGNYGVLYNIELERTSSDGRGLAVITFNARAGGQWCDGMATAMTVSEGLHPAGTYLLPTEQLVTKAPPQAVVLQVFPPLPAGEKEKIKITYSPPGASCLPTPLIFVPIDLAK